MSEELVVEALAVPFTVDVPVLAPEAELTTLEATVVVAPSGKVYFAQQPSTEG